MSSPLRLPGQLKQHLRALRKSRGLTQAQLGALVGVKQARIAEIEANPGAVSLDQLIKVLAALGGTLHLHSAGVTVPPESKIIAPAQAAKRKALVAPAKKASGPSPAGSGQIIGALVQRKATGAGKEALRTGVVIRPKKGAW
jgi:HTH-type transcriptional regulator / antitoxin HipB